MSRWTKSAALLAALSLAVVQPLQAQEDQIGIALGATPAAVVVEDLDGNPVQLADYVGGKPLLLEFWATWCPLCKALEPKIQAAYTRYGEDIEFVIIAVAVNQNPRRVRRHLERHELPGRVLWDADGRAVRAFMAPATSYVVVLDAAGKVVYTGLGEGQNIEAAVQKAFGR
jgi:thiol-disulfide isomerase/thioredoxin